LYEERNSLRLERDALSEVRDTLSEERDTLHRERDILRDERDVLRGERDVFAGLANEGRMILTDYSYDPHSRAIDLAPSGQRLVARLEVEEGRYAAVLEGIARQTDALRRIPRTQDESTGPFWLNSWFPPFDGVSLYGLIAEHTPRRYIEIGSGMSTRFARQAIKDGNLRTRITSVDPHPRAEIDMLCDEVVRNAMEEVPREFWEGIGPEDLVFVDNSHRSFPNSDVTVFFSEVMPAFPPGTIWGMHDIFLPWDYPEEWRQRFYNEQYLLLTYLLGGAKGDEILLPVAWAASRPRLHGILAPLWADEELFRGVGTHGGCFWMRRTGT
jgi:predicted O-methyltransferase YrrM